ncbi:MAG: fumarylacetoacetate hydrolase family protein [Methyloligellaceae bacterium]
MIKSWVEGTEGSGFDLNHLPFGIARDLNGYSNSLAVAIGPFALNLVKVHELGYLTYIPLEYLLSANLNAFLELGKDIHDRLRADLKKWLSQPGLKKALEIALVDRESIQMACPLAPPDFVDFYSSLHHAERSSKLSGKSVHRNWFSMPVGYHSRAGSIKGNNAFIERPFGQVLVEDRPVYKATGSLDFELELGFVVRAAHPAGNISASGFIDSVFGVSLLNDWSARDLQKWESFPLGPFHAKSFATQTASWVTPIEALLPYALRNKSQSEALDYLRHDMALTFDLHLEVCLQTPEMKLENISPFVISRSNYKHTYWDGAQQLAHITANGAPARVGDLFGSGTISGPKVENSGCLLELTSAGQNPVILPNGQQRRWLENGDTILFKGTLEKEGAEPISLGELSGTVTAGN